MSDDRKPVPVAHRAAREHLQRVHANREAAAAQTARWTPNAPPDAAQAATDPKAEDQP